MTYSEEDLEIRIEVGDSRSRRRKERVDQVGPVGTIVQVPCAISKTDGRDGRGLAI